MSNKLIALVLLGQCLIPGCANNTATPVDWQCHNQIQSAEKRYTEQEKKIDPTSRAQISGLINTAKIQQQHRQYPQCIDTSYRALSLLGYQADSDESTEPDM